MVEFWGIYILRKTTHISLFLENKAKSALEKQKDHRFLEGVRHHIQAHITFVNGGVEIHKSGGLKVLTC